MEKTLREKLFELADEEYRIFSSALLPVTETLIGVRMPALRRLAREIAENDWRAFMTAYDSRYFEEFMLQGMVLGYVKADIEELLAYAAEFVPKISCWSVCDSFCAGLKWTQKHKSRVWEFLQPYFAKSGEYEVRFGVVMLMDYYLEEEYTSQVLQRLDQVGHQGYYVKMAVAWTLATAYVRMRPQILAYFQEASLDDFTYNKALQKIIESRRVDPLDKAMIRQMKRGQGRGKSRTATMQRGGRKE